MRNLIWRQAKNNQTCTHSGVRGQATVEFALVLTVLILLLYGVLEVSRLVFIDAEIHNAASEAAHYTSLNPGATHDNLVSVIDSKLALGDRNSIGVADPDYVTDNGMPCNFCQVRVTVTYTWTTLVPILKLGPVILHSTATTLIEGAGN